MDFCFMNRAFEIRLYTNEEQKLKLNQTFGTCRFVYNNILGLRQSYFNVYGFKYKDLDIMDMLKEFEPWLNNIGSQALCQSLNDLNKAYKNWFNSLSKITKQKSKAPKFKKKSDKQSYRDCMMKKNIFEL